MQKNISLFLLHAIYKQRYKKSIEAVTLGAQKKRITIAIEPQETMLPMINADAGKISRVLRNLLDNAIKYTGDGGSYNSQTSRQRQ